MRLNIGISFFINNGNCVLKNLADKCNEFRRHIYKYFVVHIVCNRALRPRTISRTSNKKYVF